MVNSSRHGKWIAQHRHREVGAHQIEKNNVDRVPQLPFRVNENDFLSSWTLSQRQSIIVFGYFLITFNFKIAFEVTCMLKTKKKTHLHVFAHKHNHRDVERKSEKSVNGKDDGHASITPRFHKVFLSDHLSASATDINIDIAVSAACIIYVDTASEQQLVGDQCGATVVMVAVVVFPSIVIGHCSTIVQIPDGMSGAEM